MKTKKVYLTQETVRWYLENPEVYDSPIGVVPPHHHDEIIFLLANAMSGIEFQGYTKAEPGSEDGVFKCYFGPIHSYFTLDKRNRTVDP